MTFAFHMLGKQLSHLSRQYCIVARKKQAKLLKKMSFTKQDSEETNSVITDGGSQVLIGKILLTMDLVFEIDRSQSLF